jgi:DNA-binding transcriptional LysR family regulator
MKLPELKPAGVIHFSSYDQLIHAAVDGQGIALGMLPLIDRLLKDRKLVALFPGEVASPRGYCVLGSPRSARRPEVAAFIAWLTAQARAPGSARRRGRAPA